MDEKTISAALFSLFDRQRFEQNERLARLIRETESRYDDRALADDALCFVSAAGEPMPQREAAPDEGERV